MNNIRLQQTLPQVFAGRDAIVSDIWHRDITFHKGKRYLIKAASGTGKSSLCSYIYGYRQDYQGIINFDGRNIRSLSVDEWTDIRKCSLSILFQELRIFPELTAFENVQLKNRLTGFKKKKEILTWFEAFDITDKIDEKAGKLSFGQQQRVAFIRSLCQPFDFIFLDEPVSHLDDTNGAIMSRLLTEEAGRQGAGIVVMSVGKHLEMEYDERYSLSPDPSPVGRGGKLLNGINDF
ncbi:MAG: ATP-binding cassette domain-containing protein [Bacteroides sp.]|nr:ATP-binding cassette domain-containing protein [Bacteroides sp.]